MTSKSGSAAPLSPQQDTAAYSDSAVIPHRHPNGANGARPKCTSKYGLLAPADTAGNPAAAEIQVRGDGHEATIGMGDQGKRETETGNWARQRALLAHGMPEDVDK